MIANKKKKHNSDLSFYSEEMFVSKRYLVEHHLKLTYQRQSITDLDLKHKEWSKHFGN